MTDGRGLWSWLRPRLDLVVLALFMGSLLLLPKGVPGGIAAVGARAGAGLALQAMGAVLILRATRIFNFAQVQLGAITGLVFYELIHHSQLVLLGYVACPGCFQHLPADPLYLQTHAQVFANLLDKYGYANLVAANFWVSLVLSLLIAPLLSWVVYIAVIRRFERAPRLIVTVVTLAVASVLVAVTQLIPAGIFQDQRIEKAFAPSVLKDVTFTIRPTILHTGDLVTFVVVLIAAVGLAGFLRFTSAGVAMRGVADNPSRAQTLGISVARVSSMSWALAGLLSGMAAILGVLQGGTGGSPGTGLAVAPLVQMLTAVVIARLISLPLAAAGAVCLGIVEQVFSWNFGSSVPYDGALLVIICGVLLLQAARESRADRAAEVSYLSAREARPIPRELRNVPLVETYIRRFGIATGILVLGYPWVATPAQVSLGSVIVIYTIIGLSLLVLTGWAGQISLGQFAFAAVGGYVASVVAARTGMFILMDLLLGGLAGSLLAVVVGIPALRMRGLYLAVTTLAFALATSSVLLNAEALGQFLPSSVDRPYLLGFDLNDERVFFYLCLLFLGLTFALVARLRRSRMGRALIAARDNEQAAQSFGISIFRARLEAFAISGFLAAFAGALFAYQEHAVNPVAFAPEQSLQVFNLVVIGGLGSVIGPLLGAAYNGIGVLFNNEIIALATGGIGVLAVLMLYPTGLSGMAHSIRDAWLRRVAIRNRIVVPSLLADVRTDGHQAQALIAPKFDEAGGIAYVPTRYRLDGQWETFAASGAAVDA